MKITLIIFVVEGLIMVVVGHAHPPRNFFMLPLIDAASLSVLSFPMIFFWVIRPFIRARMQSDERFRQLAENIDEVFWMRNPDFTDIIYVSPQFAHLWGKSCDSLHRDPELWFEAIHAEDRERVRAEVEKARMKKFDVEYRIVRPDGRISWIRDRGFPIQNGSDEISRVAGIAEDITERKKTERALENEARLASALEAIDEGVWDWNIVTGEVHFTPRWPEMFGYTCDEIEPSVETWESKLHPDDKSKVMRATKDHLGGKTPYYVSEHRMKNKRGEWIWILGRGKVIEWDGNGKPTRIVSADLDITDRKRAVEKQRELESELAHLSRLGAMGELTTVLAHEINQPLGVITSGTQLLRNALSSGAGDRESMLNAAELVAEQAERVGDLIHRIRSFVSKERTSRRSTSLKELVGDIASLIRLDAERNDIEIQLELGKDLPAVLADPIHIQQVILNLVRNAMESMSQDRSRPKRITISAEASADDTVKVSVRDTGKGIPTEIRDQIFDPFFTTKPTGLGMGLSICRTIIQAHEGALWATSNDSDGAGFMFTLPVFKGSYADDERADHSHCR